MRVSSTEELLVRIAYWGRENRYAMVAIGGKAILSAFFEAHNIQLTTTYCIPAYHTVVWFLIFLRLLFFPTFFRCIRFAAMSTVCGVLVLERWDQLPKTASLWD